MGFLKDLFKSKTTSNKQPYSDFFIDGRTPIYQNERGDYIFYDDVCNAAISCIVNEMRKAKMYHVKEVNGQYQKVNGNYQAVLSKPNKYMNMTDFISVITYQYYKNGNVYVYPIYKDGKLSELIPLTPLNVEFTEDSNGEPYITFLFQDGTKSPAIPYFLITHIRKDFRGAGLVGSSNNEYLNGIIKLNNNVQQNIANASKNTIQGILTYGNILNEKTAAEARKRFEDALQNQTAGILTLGAESTFTQLSNNSKIVDSETLKFIDEKILRNFGISLAFLNGDYTPQQYLAFHNKVIEVIFAVFSDAFTNGLFGKDAITNGNKIIFTLNDTTKTIISDEAKISFLTLSGQIGLLTRNEMRSMFYLPPLNGPEGNEIPMNNAFSNVSDTITTDKEADTNAKE